MEEFHKPNQNDSLNVPESFYNEKIKKKSKFSKTVKNISVSSVCIFLSLIIGGAFSFMYVFLEEIIIPKFANKSIVTNQSNISENSDINKIKNVSDSISNIINTVKPSVVTITTLTQQKDFFNMPINSQDNGSGIIFHKTSSEVYVVTNYHVVQNATSIGVAIEDKEPVSAKLMAKDPNYDLAVLSIKYSDLLALNIKDVKVAKFGNSENLLTGDYAIAIGNALGEGNTATFGIISATSRDIVVSNRSLNVIQTTAAINPGNSGGALVNSNGEVIGINTAKINSNVVEGIGYSISSNIAIPLIEQMMNNTNPATLGVYIADAASDQNSNYKMGALIIEVMPNGSAFKAGLKANDIITGLNENPILNSKQLIEEMKKYSIKNTIKVKILRNGKVLTIKVKLIPQSNLQTSF